MPLASCSSRALLSSESLHLVNNPLARYLTICAEVSCTLFCLFCLLRSRRNSLCCLETKFTAAYSSKAANTNRRHTAIQMSMALTQETWEREGERHHETRGEMRGSNVVSSRIPLGSAMKITAPPTHTLHWALVSPSVQPPPAQVASSLRIAPKLTTGGSLMRKQKQKHNFEVNQSGHCSQNCSFPSIFLNIQKLI